MTKHGDMTVADTTMALLEDVQSRQVLRLWDNITTLLHDVEEDAKRVQFGVSLLGLDLSDYEGKELHRHIVKVPRVYVDRQRPLEMFGTLKFDTQT
jgi:hypothetical protein